MTRNFREAMVEEKAHKHRTTTQELKPKIQLRDPNAKSITDVILCHQRETMRWRIMGPFGDAPGTRGILKDESPSQLALLNGQK